MQASDTTSTTQRESTTIAAFIALLNSKKSAWFDIYAYLQKRPPATANNDGIRGSYHGYGGGRNNRGGEGPNGRGGYYDSRPWNGRSNVAPNATPTPSLTTRTTPSMTLSLTAIPRTRIPCQRCHWHFDTYEKLRHHMHVDHGESSKTQPYNYIQFLLPGTRSFRG